MVWLLSAFVSTAFSYYFVAMVTLTLDGSLNLIGSRTAFAAVMAAAAAMCIGNTIAAMVIYVTGRFIKI